MTGQRVYKRDDFADFLLYDYNLIAGDTIWRRNYVDSVPYRVDSVYYKKMGNRRLKAWHLTLADSFKQNKMEWVEGLGEIKLGWDIKIYGFTEMTWVVKGICLHDTLIYWNYSTNFISDPNTNPSCMFDSIQNALSAKKVVSNSINIYPNPASDELTVCSMSDGILNVVDQTGKVCIAKLPIRPGAQTFDITVLQPGIYLVAIQTTEGLFYRRICVFRP